MKEVEEKEEREKERIAVGEREIRS